MATISSPGLGSGLDINGIITKLMSVETQPLNKLNTKEASYQAKISALGSLQGAVSTLDTALASLIPSSSKTTTTSASFANSAAGSATVGTGATTASYTVSIEQLATSHRVATQAQAQKLVSGTYASAFSSITPGTFTIKLGSGNTQSISVTPANASLTGLKNAINAAGLGVTAGIVPDGGTVRLVLESNTIGNAGKMVTTNSGGLTGFDFDGSTGSLSQDSLVGGRTASGFNATTDTVGSGTLELTVGSNPAKQITIDSTNNTLAGLKDAINGASAGVTASLVNVGTNNVRLVLESNGTGTSSKISVSGIAGLDYDATSNTGSLSQASSNGGQASVDAGFTIDGTSYTRSSNTVSDVVTGVTLKLSQTTTAATTLTVKNEVALSFAEQSAAKFRTYKATLADSSIASATSSENAVPGSYALDVVQLATTHRISTPLAQPHVLSTATPVAQQIRSGLFSGSTVSVNSSGMDQTLDITVGGSTEQITVTDGMTLTALQDAINAVNSGVMASLVNDGSSVRLALSSNTAGASGAITTSGSAGLSGFNFDPVTETGDFFVSQAAKGYSSSADTIATGTFNLQVGSGTPTPITINSSNNTLYGLQEAINAANAGVTASIVTDGLGVRLKLTSATSGTAGEMSTSGIAGFDFDPLTATGSLSQSSAAGGQPAQGFTSTGATLPTGTLQITVGGSIRNVTIDSSNNTLAGIKDAINAISAGVTASLISTGSDVRLVLTSNTSGSSGKISLSGIKGLGFDANTGTGNFSQAVADGGQPAQSAIAKINGVSVTSESNTITDAVQGVTLNLTKVTTSATTLTVAQDKTTSMSAALTSVVKAYNELAKAMKDMGSYNAETKSGGVLLGNATLRSVSTSIKNALQAATPETTLGVKRLSDLGLSMQKDGTIVFDASKLTAAAAANYDAVATVAASIGKATKAITASMLGTQGVITAATEGNKASIDALEKQRIALNARLTQVEARYRKQFTALDSLVASMNTTSSYLTRQLASLPGASSSSA